MELREIKMELREMKIWSCEPLNPQSHRK